MILRVVMGRCNSLSVIYGCDQTETEIRRRSPTESGRPLRVLRQASWGVEALRTQDRDAVFGEVGVV